MQTCDPRNMAISFAGNVFPGFGGSEILNDGPEPMPLCIVFKRTSRKARQKFLAAKARELGTTIRETKRFYGNGSRLTIPGCRISHTVGGPFSFDSGDVGVRVECLLRNPGDAFDLSKFLKYPKNHPSTERNP